jgi:hypothetical protein
MKNVCVHCLIILSLPLACVAQNTPWWELHAGYQFTSYRTGQMQNLIDSVTSASNLPAVNVASQINMNGWNFSRKTRTVGLAESLISVVDTQVRT